MSAEQLVLALAGTAAIVASLIVVVVTRPRPASLLEVVYGAAPVLGVIALVAAVRASL
jgi:hypothetical protein